jgi:hypothetical protein
MFRCSDFEVGVEDLSICAGFERFVKLSQNEITKLPSVGDGDREGC